jgi:hypothetical protein
MKLYEKSTRALRYMRQKIWDYDNTPKESQAERVLAYLKARSMRDNPGFEGGAYTRNAYAEVMWM